MTAAWEVLQKPKISLNDFAALISPAATELLEPLGRRAQQLTRQRFGKVIRLFAPLYLSNECINNCKYCGFSRDNPILRVTLTVDDVKREAEALLMPNRSRTPPAGRGRRPRPGASTPGAAATSGMVPAFASRTKKWWLTTNSFCA